jgi:hypothetical protein
MGNRPFWQRPDNSYPGTSDRMPATLVNWPSETEDVMQRARMGEITWREAASLLGVTVHQVRARATHLSKRAGVPNKAQRAAAAKAVF